ncbi:MAG: Na+/H+ antiporter NhaC family protein [Staphylococcus equorum]|nr:Na+/H+ antiporter NhaC family protein [Staphylococcus equorum]
MKKKGQIKGILPLIAFLVIYMATGFITGDFESMPLLIGMMITLAIALLLNKDKDYKESFNQKLAIFARGAGDETIILMIFIFMLAGGFYATAEAMGAVDSISNLGLSILPEKMLLPGLFMISALVSFSMGTSVGTIAALVPIAIDLSQKTQSNLALFVGIVVGGAMFGDNLSFISDTTLAASRTQEIPMKDKFKENFLLVIPAIFINLFLLFMQKVDTTALNSKVYDYHFIEILPYLFVIILSIMGWNVIIVLTTGILSGMAIGLMSGHFTLIQFMGIIHEGMKGMQDIAMISLFVGGLVALMNYLGGIDWLLYRLTKNTKTKRGAEFSIAGLVSVMDIATTNNTISIIASGPLARDIADEYEISRARSASILDIFSAAFNGLLPYASQLLVAAGISGIAPVEIMFYNWYSMLMILVGLLSISFQLPKSSTTK